MTAFFNTTLFKRNLIRFWPLAVVAFLAALIVFVLPELTNPNNNLVGTDQFGVVLDANQYGTHVIHGTKNIMPPLAVYCAVIAFLLSIFTAIAVLGYLHNPKAAGFLSSLPITRKGLYITNLLSGLTLMLAPLLLVGTLYGILLIGQPVPPWDFLRWVGALIASHLIFYSIAVFCTFLTGNPIMQAFIYAVLNFICIVLYTVGTALASILMFGYEITYYSSVYDFIEFLSPPVAVARMIELMAPQWIFSMNYDSSLPVLLLWAAYLVFSAVLIVFGWLLYKRRHVEVAGEVIVHRPVKSVFKYLIGLLAGVLFALLLMMFTVGRQTSNISTLTVWFTVSTMIFGALGCFFTEMLIQKRLHVWKTTYKGVIIFVLSIVTAVLFIRLDGSGFERRVPDKNDVASVSVTAAHMHYTSIHGLERGFGRITGDNWHLTMAYRESRRTLSLPVYDSAIINEIKLRTPVYFESPEAIAAAVKLHQTIADHGWYTVEAGDNFESTIFYQTYTITYTMKNGSIMNRVYVLPIAQTDGNNLVELLLDLYNKPEAVDKRNRFIDLPDSAIIEAVLTPTYDDYWLARAHYQDRIFQGEKIFFEDDLSIILEALRMDAADGSLGRLRHADLLPADYIRTDVYIVNYIRDDVSTSTVGVIDLLVNPGIAGVPPGFELDHLEDRNGDITVGLVLSVIINESHVNTLRVIEELGRNE